jgi:hypothetical protein
MDSFVIMNKLKQLLAVEVPSEHGNELQAYCWFTSVRIMTRLWADQQRNHGSIPGREKHSVGSGVHSVSNWTGTGSHFQRDKVTRE